MYKKGNISYFLLIRITKYFSESQHQIMHFEYFKDYFYYWFKRILKNPDTSPFFRNEARL